MLLTHKDEFIHWKVALTPLSSFVTFKFCLRKKNFTAEALLLSNIYHFNFTIIFFFLIRTPPLKGWFDDNADAWEEVNRANNFFLFTCFKTWELFHLSGHRIKKYWRITTTTKKRNTVVKFYVNVNCYILFVCMAVKSVLTVGDSLTYQISVRMLSFCNSHV